MMINAATQDALDRIAQRAADVQRAFIPGALPQFGDVATDHSASILRSTRFALHRPTVRYF